ncbi:MAG: hypothetical protein QOJ16_1812 [Acidobacteriota bacterium]|jgi:hypothetical protein|nr:hypothetical protein [Acidobacteriota bacterium]
MRGAAAAPLHPVVGCKGAVAAPLHSVIGCKGAAAAPLHSVNGGAARETFCTLAFGGACHFPPESGAP